MTDGVSGPLTAKEIVENVHSKSNAKKGMDFGFLWLGYVLNFLKSYQARDIW